MAPFEERRQILRGGEVCWDVRCRSSPEKATGDHIARRFGLERHPGKRRDFPVQNEKRIQFRFPVALSAEGCEPFEWYRCTSLIRKRLLPKTTTGQ